MVATKTAFVATLCLLICDAAYGKTNHKHDDDTPSCSKAYFPCYKDCCPLDDWFCGDWDRRCHHCDTRKMLCGNDTALPRDCRLYCYKLRHPPDNSHDDDDDSRICLDMKAFIAVAAAPSLGIVCLIAICLRKWLCTILHRDRLTEEDENTCPAVCTGDPDPNTTEPTGQAPDISTDTINLSVRQPLLPPQPRPPSSAPSSDSGTMADIQADNNSLGDLNDNAVGVEEPMRMDPQAASADPQPDTLPNPGSRGELAGRDAMVSTAPREPGSADGRVILQQDHDVGHRLTSTVSRGDGSVPNNQTGLDALNVKMPRFNEMNPTSPEGGHNQNELTTGTENPVGKIFRNQTSLGQQQPH